MATQPTYLGLDLGTSGLRGLLVSADGQVIGSAEAHYEVAYPYQGWAEQSPSDWINAVETIFNQLHKNFPNDLSALQGVGVSGHMHGAVLLNESDQVLRPCILWNDTRSEAEAAELDANPEFRSVSGNIVFPGFTAPKLVWIKKNEPEIFDKIAKVVLPSAYMNLWLTGEHVCDISDASGSSWLDVHSRGWSQELLRETGLSEQNMPRLVEGSAKAGELKSEIREKFGITETVIVAGGGADNAVAACGAGAFSEGDGFVSLGTSGVLLLTRDVCSPMPETAVHTFCHAVPNKWYQMGVILAATDSLNWLSKQLDKNVAELSDQLSTQIEGPGEIQFLPYISGERTPHNDSTIRGAFLNLDVSSGQSDLTQAVMEGVAFALRDSLEALRQTGADPESLMAIGGGSQSAYWVELCATVLNLPLNLPSQSEFGAALGAARLAICASSGVDPKTVMTKPEIAKTIRPRSELVIDYEAAYQNWRKIYPKLKELT